MSEPFNPYYVWLGIPPREQPANRYRLLSISLFESNPEVIDNAADQRTAHLRTFQSSKNAQLAERLLNEVAAARICLLDPKKRAAYDQGLRAQLAGQSPASAANGGPQPASGGTSLPVAVPLTAVEIGRPAKPIAAQAPARRLPMSMVVGAGILLIVAIGVGMLALGGRAADGALTFDWPADARTGAALTVDGIPVPIPDAGPWEYPCPPGKHEIVANRPAFKLETIAIVASGEKHPIAAEWKPKAMLILEWRPIERKDAVLQIDGIARTAPPSQPIEFPVEPGSHVVQVTRPLSEPFEQKVVLADDERRVVPVRLPAWPTLLLNWPMDQREGAAVSIDNEPAPFDPSAARPEFHLKPGQHAIRITRPGYQTFNLTTKLSLNVTTSFSPRFVPAAVISPPSVAKPIAVNDPPPPVKPPPSSPPVQPAPTVAPPVAVAKLAVPSPAEQERIAKSLAEVYEVTHSPAKDKALVAELFKTAAESGNSPAERYMLLTKAVDVAAEVGDYDTAFQGIDTLAASYEIDPFEAKQTLLKDSIKSVATSSQVAGLLAAAEQIIDQCVATDKLDDGLAMVATAKEAISKRPSDFRIFKEDDEQLTRRRREITALQKSWAATEDARKTLQKDPDNADAHLALGRWLCLLKNDWAAGLPHLAKGSDAALKALAEQEIASNLDEKEQTKLANNWWDFAQKEADIEREGARQHAAELYRIALPKWQSPLKQAMIEGRLVELATIQPHGGRVSPSSTGGPFAHGQWVDLLRLVSPATDAIYGDWSRNGGDLVCEPVEFARISFPLEINASYDLEIDFTRKLGNDDVNVILPVGEHACMVMLSTQDGKTSGLSRVGGISVRDQHMFAIHPGKLENDRRYRLLISVRLIKGGKASIEVLLQGKPIWPLWKGPTKDLLSFAGWSLPTPQQIGLGVWNDKVLFHSIRLKVFSGDVSIPPAAATRPPTTRILAARFGGGNNWADVTQRVLDIARNSDAVWASTNFLEKDPTPGWKKQLVITVDQSGNRHDLWINEGDAYRMDAALSK